MTSDQKVSNWRLPLKIKFYGGSFLGIPKVSKIKSVGSNFWGQFDFLELTLIEV